MMNKNVKKSFENSKNVLEEKLKIVKRKICIKKDTHVYNNCYELRSRAINKANKTNTMLAKQIARINRQRNFLSKATKK